MSRIMSVSALAVAIGLVSAPLAFAQGGSTTGSAGGTTETRAQATQAPAAKGRSAYAKHAPVEKIDLNSASREQLEKLPGIDEATAEKIVAGRPLKSKNELVARGIVSKSEYARISSQVVAKPAKATK